jgi:hypothetical protein
MINNTGKPWCPAQDQQLLSLVRAGKSVTEVADAMGRTLAGIIGRADRLSYRLTSTDQYTTLSAFIQSAHSPAATTCATQCVTDGIEGAHSRTPGLQACPSLLFEVQTERLPLVLHALENAGFGVKSKLNLPSRYVVRDAENSGKSV